MVTVTKLLYLTRYQKKGLLSCSDLLPNCKLAIL